MQNPIVKRIQWYLDFLTVWLNRLPITFSQRKKYLSELILQQLLGSSKIQFNLDQTALGFLLQLSFH